MRAPHRGISDVSGIGSRSSGIFRSSSAGGAQRKTHEYNAVAKQLLGQAPPAELDLKMPDEREPMPLTSEMPR